MASLGDQVEIRINHLTLEPDAEILHRDEMSKLFVEYHFLGVPAEETECPYSLPKPTTGMKISFNFSKVFHVDYDNHYERRQYLASMLLPDDPNEGKIKFTVVSEPVEEDGDCEDVGKAYANLRDIMDNNKDLNEADLEIFDVNDEKTVIGQLNVTIKCLDALRAVQMELTGNTNSAIGS